MATTTTSPRMSLVDIMMTEGIINQDQRDHAVEEYERTKRSVFRILQDMGVLTDDRRVDFLHRQTKIPVVSLQNVTPRADVVGFMSRDMCRLHQVVPLRKDGNTVMIAMEDPTDVALLGDLEKVFGSDLRPVLANLDEIHETIDRLPEAAEERKSIAEEPTTAYKLLATLSLVVLAFTPMIGSYYFININEFGREWYASWGFSQFETGLAFLITWGSWAALAYFINDLIFGTGEQ